MLKSILIIIDLLIYFSFKQLIQNNDCILEYIKQYYIIDLSFNVCIFINTINANIVIFFKKIFNTSCLISNKIIFKTFDLCKI